MTDINVAISKCIYIYICFFNKWNTKLLRRKKSKIWEAIGEYIDLFIHPSTYKLNK